MNYFIYFFTIKILKWKGISAGTFRRDVQPHLHAQRCMINRMYKWNFYYTFSAHNYLCLIKIFGSVTLYAIKTTFLVISLPQIFVDVNNVWKKYIYWVCVGYIFDSSIKSPITLYLPNRKPPRSIVQNKRLNIKLYELNNLWHAMVFPNKKEIAT